MSSATYPPSALIACPAPVLSSQLHEYLEKNHCRGDQKAPWTAPYILRPRLLNLDTLERPTAIINSSTLLAVSCQLLCNTYNSRTNSLCLVHIRAWHSRILMQQRVSSTFLRNNSEENDTMFSKWELLCCYHARCAPLHRMRINSTSLRAKRQIVSLTYLPQKRCISSARRALIIKMQTKRVFFNEIQQLKLIKHLKQFEM